MKLLFTPEALSSYNNLKAQRTHEAEQAVEVIKDILSHPREGKGNPKPLSGVLSGLWGRDYGVFRQLVYSFSDEEVKIFALGKSLPKGDTPASEVQQTAYSEDEYRSVLAQMEANRGKGETPKVGIFCTRTCTI